MITLKKLINNIITIYFNRFIKKNTFEPTKMNITSEIYNKKKFTGLSGPATNLIFCCKRIYLIEEANNNKTMPSLKRCTSFNFSNLFMICANGNLDLFKKEFSKYENENESYALNCTNQNGNNCLMISVIYGHQELASFILSKRKTNLEHLNESNYTVLMIAVKNGITEFLDMLIQYQVNINQKNFYGNTALHIATECFNLGIVLILLNNGSYIDNKNNDGFTPLILTIIFNQSLLSSFLINSCANLECFDNYGHNALYFAIKYNNSEILNYLIHKGCNLDIRYEDNYTPLMIAVYFKSNECIELLLQHNFSSLSKQNSDGHSALYIAMINYYDDIVAIFKKYK